MRRTLGAALLAVREKLSPDAMIALMLDAFKSVENTSYSTGFFLIEDIEKFDVEDMSPFIRALRQACPRSGLLFFISHDQDDHQQASLP